jgi:hypothetical protein
MRTVGLFVRGMRAPMFAAVIIGQNLPAPLAGAHGGCGTWRSQRETVGFGRLVRGREGARTNPITKGGALTSAGFFKQPPSLAVCRLPTHRLYLSPVPARTRAVAGCPAFAYIALEVVMVSNLKELHGLFETGDQMRAWYDRVGE